MRSTQTEPQIRLLAALCGLILVVAACSTSGGASVKPSTAAASQGSGTAHVVAVANGTVGAYLTGKDGMTLYIFTPDSADKSTCVDTCATTWPPFTVAAADALTPDAGVAGKLSTFARPDGTLQVSLNRAPLYYYAADTKAGETNGQGVGGKWFVAPPARAAASPAASGRSGY